MPVVADTSVVCNLAAIGRLSLLRRLYGIVWIPPSVHSELEGFGHGQGRLDVMEALQEGWIVVVQPVCPDDVPDMGLDPGETEAIRLAAEYPGIVLLLDESEGRAVAQRQGLPISGVLGILMAAKQQGWIHMIGPEIEKLRIHAGFFIGKRLEDQVLRSVDE